MHQVGTRGWRAEFTGQQGVGGEPHVQGGDLGQAVARSALGLDGWPARVTVTTRAGRPSSAEAREAQARRRGDLGPGDGSVAEVVQEDVLAHRRGRIRPMARCRSSFLRRQSSGRIAEECLGDLLQAREGQLTVSAQVALGEFPRDAGVSIPVPAAALPVLFTHRAAAVAATEGKRGELAHPHRPGKGVRDHIQDLIFPALTQSIGLMRG